MCKIIHIRIYRYKFINTQIHMYLQKNIHAYTHMF